MKLITKLSGILFLLPFVSCNPDLYWEQETPDRIEVSIDRVIMDGAGGTRTVEVFADGKFKTESSADWLSVNSSEEGIELTALSNSGLELRECVVSVSRGTARVDITVEQPGADLKFSLPRNPEQSGYEQSELEIDVKSNVAWTPVPRCEWIKTDETERQGNDKLEVEIGRNPLHEPRSGYIFFYNGDKLFYKLQITQDAAPRFVTFSPETLDLKEDGAAFSKNITLTALQEWTVDTAGASWLSIAGLPAPNPQTGAYPACDNIILTVNGEASTYCRTGIIYFESEGDKYPLTVNQKGIPTELSFDRKSLVGLPKEGASVTITITSNKRWTIGENSPWISFDRTSGEAGQTAVTVTVGTTSEDRSGGFNVTCDDVTAAIEVSQKSGTITIDLHFDLKDDSGAYIWPFTVPTDEKPGPTTFTTTEGGYEFIIKNTGGIKYQKGYLYMTGAAEGDYVKFPIIKGYALTEVYIRSYIGGSNRKLNVTDFSLGKVIGPEINLPAKGDHEYTWDLAGKTDAEHRNGIYIIKAATNFYEIKLTYK